MFIHIYRKNCFSMPRKLIRANLFYIALHPSPCHLILTGIIAAISYTVCFIYDNFLERHFNPLIVNRIYLLISWFLHWLRQFWILKYALNLVFWKLGNHWNINIFGTIYKVIDFNEDSSQTIDSTASVHTPREQELKGLIVTYIGFEFKSVLTNEESNINQ